jgi:hypothetical protein
MRTASSRQMFELALLGPYIFVVLPELFEKVHGRPYDRKVEFQRIAETRDRFKKLVKPGEDGLYSWERDEVESTEKEEEGKQEVS